MGKIYHVTYSENRNSIEKQGLTASARIKNSWTYLIHQELNRRKPGSICLELEKANYFIFKEDVGAALELHQKALDRIPDNHLTVEHLSVDISKLNRDKLFVASNTLSDLMAKELEHSMVQGIFSTYPQLITYVDKWWSELYSFDNYLRIRDQLRLRVNGENEKYRPEILYFDDVPARHIRFTDW